MSVVSPRKAIEILAEHFSKTFFVYEQRRQPLKVGIFHDLQATGVLPEEDLRGALRAYCANAVYRSRLIAGAARIDVDGNPVGEVTADQVCSSKPKSKPSARPTLVKAPALKSAASTTRLSLADLRAAAQARKAGAA
jgi:ProP effector